MIVAILIAAAVVVFLVLALAGRTLRRVSRCYPPVNEDPAAHLPGSAAGSANEGV